MGVVQGHADIAMAHLMPGGQTGPFRFVHRRWHGYAGIRASRATAAPASRPRDANGVCSGSARPGEYRWDWRRQGFQDEAALANTRSSWPLWDGRLFSLLRAVCVGDLAIHPDANNLAIFADGVFTIGQIPAVTLAVNVSGLLASSASHIDFSIWLVGVACCLRYHRWGRHRPVSGPRHRHQRRCGAGRRGAQ